MAKLELRNAAGKIIYDSSTDRKFILHQSITVQTNQWQTEWRNDSYEPYLACFISYAGSGLDLFISDPEFTFNKSQNRIYYFELNGTANQNQPPAHPVFIDLFRY